MKKTVLNLPIKDLNDLEMRFLDENKICVHTFAEILHKQFVRVSIPLPQVDLYKGILAKLEAAQTAEQGSITEFTDDEFKIVAAKAERSFDTVTKFRWDMMMGKQNTYEQQTEK